MPLTWEELQIGTETGRAEITVSEAQLEEYLDVVELNHPYFDGKNGQARPIPPDLLGKLGMNKLFQDFLQEQMGPNMRAKQAFEYRGPVHVGEKLVAVGYVADKYEKRGKYFVTLEAVFKNTDGVPVVTDRRTQLMLPAVR